MGSLRRERVAAGGRGRPRKWLRLARPRYNSSGMVARGEAVSVILPVLNERDNLEPRTAGPVADASAALDARQLAHSPAHRRAHARHGVHAARVSPRRARRRPPLW